MLKRILSIMTAAVLLFTLLPAVPVRAASEMTASQQLADMVKEMEGFAEYPYWDTSQWSVGYGTKPLTDEDLARYQAEGISEEEAEELLFHYLNSKGTYINKLIDNYGLELEQHEFDALLSFTYNSGQRWTLEESSLRTAVVEGYTGNDFLFAIGKWSLSGGKVLTGLIKRRMIEANMYLNGEYSLTPPENYCYVIYNAGYGKVEASVQVFDVNLSDGVDFAVSDPTYDGYLFKGWYTSPYSGERVTALDDTVDTLTLYAQWRAFNGADVPRDPADTYDAETVDYNRKVTAEYVSIFASPLQYASVVGVKETDAVVHIVAEFTDCNGITWGKIEHSGWINLSATEETTEAATTAVTVVVNASSLSIRTGPGTNYDRTGNYLWRGDSVTITQVQTGGNYTWGKFEDGWIALELTNYFEVIEPELPDDSDFDPETDIPATEPTTEPTTAPTEAPEEDGSSEYPRMGTITASSLWIRSGPGTGYATAGSLSKGDRVEILEVQEGSDMDWGRIEDGWISMTYVELDPLEETETAVTGTVALSSGSTLNVRSGPGTSYTAVGSLSNGAKVTILEQQTVDGVTWGRIEDGWICMDFVELDKAPALNVYGKTLLLEDIVRINYYFTLTDIADSDIKTSGLQVWNQEDYAAAGGNLTASGASYTVAGLTKNGAYYTVQSQGIPAKNMGDILYARGYVTLTDGTTVYSETIEYSAAIYAKNQYNNSSTDAQLKKLVIALMNYGAAAQVKFGYDTDNLMNSFLTSTEKNFSWSSSQLSVNGADTAGKYKLQTSGSADIIKKISKTLTLEGSLSVNIYAVIDEDTAASAQEIGILYWDADTYAGAARLTVSNAVKVKANVSGGYYAASITGVAAKNIGKGCYTCVYVVDANGNTHYSELVAYNAHDYAANQISKNTDADLVNLCKTLVIYGNQAAAYFES